MGLVHPRVDPRRRGDGRCWRMSKVAFCFPGQGSQRVGMGREVARDVPEAREVLDAAAAAAGFDLARVCFEGPVEELNRTEITQPALVATSLAVLRAVQSGAPSLRPDVVIGHSVGEYAAIAAAEGLSVADAVHVVRERGLAVAESKAEGVMAAVLGLADEDVERLCGESGDVWPANYNCPGQVVISGRESGVDRVAERARELGARVVRLRVSGPFHSPLVADAAERLGPVLRETRFAELRTPF